MATIMTHGNRRCDAVCHKATGETCACICGGKYHGSSNKNPEVLEAVVRMISNAVPPMVPEEPRPMDALFEQAENCHN